MNKSTTKSVLLALMFCTLSVGTARGYDSVESPLSGAVGATDYYRLTCPAGTDHLHFKASQTAPLDSRTQQQNVRVVKSGVEADARAVTPGKTGEASLAGGNGKYRVTVDTKGSAGASKQAYALSFQCLNTVGQPVKTSVTSKSGTLKAKPKSYSVTCKGKGASGAAEQLLVYLSNITKSGQPLIAQVVKGFVASSSTDGRDAESLPGGSGDYYVTIAHTGTSAGVDRQYVFEASCLDSAEAVSGDPTVLQLQDDFPASP